jgi:Spy/CpxP family protein refolding chaperone
MKITTMSLAALLCAGALLAQQGSPKWGQRPNGAPTDKVKAFLNLTDQQVQDLTAVQVSFRQAARPLRQQMEEKAKAQRQASAQNPVDSALVTQLQADLASLRTQQQSLHATYRTQALNILSDQQKTGLANLQQALDLMPAAHQAAGLNLLELPQGFQGGPGARRFGRGPRPAGFGAGPPPEN